jgi:hypothetical protein
MVVVVWEGYATRHQAAKSVAVTVLDCSFGLLATGYKSSKPLDSDFGPRVGTAWSDIGQTARSVREWRGISRRAAGLGVSAVHLSSDVRGRMEPSSLIWRFNDVYSSDVSALAFCLDDDTGGSVGLRNARHTLADAMPEVLIESPKAG